MPTFGLTPTLAAVEGLQTRVRVISRGGAKSAIKILNQLAYLSRDEDGSSNAASSLDQHAATYAGTGGWLRRS